MKTVKLQQGDSFVMNFVLKVDGTPTNLNAGEDLVVGFYNECRGKYIIRYSQNQIKHATIGDGTYTAHVPSSATKNFIGNVDVEIVVYDKHGEEVSHADKILKMLFEERRINNEI